MPPVMNIEISWPLSK